MMGPSGSGKTIFVMNDWKRPENIAKNANDTENQSEYYLLFSRFMGRERGGLKKKGLSRNELSLSAIRGIFQKKLFSPF